MTRISGGMWHDEIKLSRVGIPLEHISIHRINELFLAFPIPRRMFEQKQPADAARMAS